MNRNNVFTVPPPERSPGAGSQRRMGFGGFPAKRDKPVRPFGMLRINFGEGRQALHFVQDKL